jgi:hypothetical protein
VFGVITCSLPKFRDKLNAILKTWAKRPRAQGRFIAIGARNHPTEWQDHDIIASDCDDEKPGLSCKEASLIAEASKSDPDWLFIVGDDNYVDTEKVEAALQFLSPRVAIGSGILGFGKGVPKQGQLVFEKGGLCGGGGEAISRAALQALVHHGREALVREYGRHSQCDMSTSRALLQRNVTLKPFPAKLTLRPQIRKQHLEEHLRAGVVVFHYVTPELMRWLYVKTAGTALHELPALEASAFDHGCVRYPSTAPWAKKVHQCLAQASVVA